MRPYNILIIFLAISFIPKTLNRQCGDEQIDNCEVCASGDELGTCAKCDDHHFNFLFNYLCLPCDHKVYGDVGCEKNCVMNQEKLDFRCDEFGCKNGFYSINKMDCMNCYYGSPNCAKCTYLPPAGQSPATTDERIFTCNECINDDYRIFSDGRCHHCYKPHCADCHFYGNTTKSICDRCYFDYYLRGEDCVKCRHYPIYGGYCRQCTDDPTDYDNIFCYCNYTYYHTDVRKCGDCPRSCWSCSNDTRLTYPRCHYCRAFHALNRVGQCKFCGIGCSYCSINFNNNPVCYYCMKAFELLGGKCYKCPSHCKTCHLGPDGENFICDECFADSAMDDKGICHQCGHACNKCQFDENKNLKCTSCFNYYWFDHHYYGLHIDGTCQRCPSNCAGCTWMVSKNGFGCTGCYYQYALKNGDCPFCPSISAGCYSCSYNTMNPDKLDCYNCVSRSYAHSTNSLECIYNLDPNNKQLYGCLRATYNYTSGKYECNICKPEFIPILNDKNCRPPETAGLHSICREAINIGTEENPIYSCLSCKSYYHTNVTDHRGAHDCYYSTGELVLCEKATKDINNNLQCTKCFGNFKFINSTYYNKMICNENCEPDAFKKNYWCYACDDPYWGNPGCVKEKGCSYISSNDQLNCNECKVGYFRFTHGQCFKCKEGSPACLECHMNETLDRFECDKCIDGYFVNVNKKCQVITC
ncbi:MAG: hypothetical protein VZR33_08955, partial [Methanosphaera sp.]|nr:hypothetical protein [Methanosphaera sp.]